MEINEITGDVLDAAMKLHREFGPGLFESVYERILQIELENRGHRVCRQLPISFVYGGVCFHEAFRLDLLVDEEVVVEIKAVSAMHPVFSKQVKTCLVLTGRRIGLLINFGMVTLRDGFVRVINSKLPDVRAEGKKINSMRLDLDLSLDKDAVIRDSSLNHMSLSPSASPRDAHLHPDSLCASASPSDAHLHPDSLRAPASPRDAHLHRDSLCASASPRDAHLHRDSLCASASPRDAHLHRDSLCASASPRDAHNQIFASPREAHS